MHPQHSKFCLVLLPIPLLLIAAFGLLTGLVTHATAAEVTLGWDPNQEPNLGGYILYGREGSPGPPYDYIDTYPLEILEPQNPRCQVTDLNADSVYYFAVTAYSTEGLESTYSNEVCVTGGRSCECGSSGFGSIWHTWFAVDPKETPMVGDFNGDGKTDIIVFTRDNPKAVGDVYVALSDGTQFGNNTKWHDWFAINHDETVVIGDYDGDGKDDIATWLKTTTKQVYVALSYGTGMQHENVWLDRIGIDDGDLLFSGNFDGDSYDDLILFARDTGKVYVSSSTGSSFLQPALWHDWFAVSTYERPRVGDLNGDGMDDIITFATDSPTARGDVFVAMSDGFTFGENQKWHDWFAVEPSQMVRIGDLNADGAEDFVSFLPPPLGQIYSVLSLETTMADNVLLYDNVLLSGQEIPFLGDVNADGKADIILFCQEQGVVKVAISN